MFEYIRRFEKMCFGMFVHFGLYSVFSKGEWAKTQYDVSDEEYENLMGKFNVSKNWAKNLVHTAKSAGCKYITLTTRHHDGFSLYDTCGLNEYDAPHSSCGRDLIREFVKECNEQGIKPFFYHTLIDWHEKTYFTDMPKYLEYLNKSIEILCRNYGPIGGFWFDGMWDRPDSDWQEDRLYGMIRKYQPEAMIINNTGLSAKGKVGHYQLDSVTFERGKPTFVDNADKPRAGEMCQILNDHWGYARDDLNYKSIGDIIKDLVDSRKYDCNFLLNVGLKGNGAIKPYEKYFLQEIGKWIKANKSFIYNAKSCDIVADNAVMLKDDKYYYAVIYDVPMSANLNVAIGGKVQEITVNKNIRKAVWLDNNEKIELLNKNSFKVKPFKYGISMVLRVARLELELDE